MSKNKKQKHSSNINVSTNIIRLIEIDIITGKFVAGRRIPSIVDISDSYNVGKTTAHKVVDSLCEDNIIHLKKGIGYFVKPYVVQKLLKKHMDYCTGELEMLIDCYDRLGVSKEDFLKIVDSLYEK